MAIRNVLKTFRLSRPHAAGSNRNDAPPEMVFLPGEQEIPDDILGHPYMKSGADGCIESEVAAKERFEKLKQAAELATRLAGEANARAKAAYQNLVAAHNQTHPNAPMDEDALNTPISVLRARENENLTPEAEAALIEQNNREREEALKAQQSEPEVTAKEDGAKEETAKEEVAESTGKKKKA